MYKVQELSTSGWFDTTGPLNKDECKTQYEKQLSEGISPERLRVVRVS
jgi:hypothetical protein